MTVAAVAGIRGSIATWTRRRPALNLSVGLGMIAVVIVFAILVPLTSKYDPTAVSATDALQPPSLHHLLGTDDLGRDVFVRVAAGYRISVLVAVGSVFLATVVGIPLGLVAGYFGGVTDQLIARPMDVLMSFPAVLLAIVVMTIFGTGTTVLIAAMGIVYVPVIVRIMRSSTVLTARAPYVEAIRARGTSHFRLLLVHVLPNSAGPAIVQAFVLMGVAILLESALDFIGLGVQPPNPSLGLMLASERDFLQSAPWTAIFPGAAIMVLVLAFNLIGDGLRDRLDPRTRARLE